MHICSEPAIHLPIVECDVCDELLERVKALEALLYGKQDKLIPGSHIEITDNVISATNMDKDEILDSLGMEDITISTTDDERKIVDAHLIGYVTEEQEPEPPQVLATAPAFSVTLDTNQPYDIPGAVVNLADVADGQYAIKSVITFADGTKTERTMTSNIVDGMWGWSFPLQGAWWDVGRSTEPYMRINNGADPNSYSVTSWVVTLEE